LTLGRVKGLHPPKMYLLPFTAALHYFAAIPIAANYTDAPNHRLNRIYFGTILLASTLSILMHLYPNSTFLVAEDHTFAALWFALDYLWYKLLNKSIIFEANICILLMYILSTSYQNYELTHSVWHVFSAAKCIYVSYIISKFDGAV